jgi:Na+/melibiose symporter-like transporter
MGVMFTMSQLFQLIMGYGAFQSSLALIPMMLPMLFLAPIIPKIVRKIGSRWTVTTGLILIAIGFFAMTFWPTVPSFWEVLGGMILLVVGMTFTTTPATNMLMAAVPKARSGMGSAMNDTTRELGAALGIAVLGAVLSSAYERNIASAVAGMPEQARDIAQNSLAGALSVAQHMGIAGTELLEAAKIAWMNSIDLSMTIAGVICLAAAIVTAIWLPHHHKPGVDDELQVK